MAGTVFVGSHEKPDNAYGQNGSPQSSSLLPGETKSPIKDVSPPQHGVEALPPENQLSARVHMGADGKAVGYSSHPAMPPRTPGSGSPGGVNVIPAKSNHSAKR